MTDFSIEMASERIYDPRIKNYFEEVQRSYQVSNYRSAVVTLWTVVVCDLLFKLDQLANAHRDPTARSILAELETLRKSNPRSSDWEWTLVKRIKDRTQLLDEAEYSSLRNLQEHRHLSAHPVITAAEVLFTPSKEVARAHIRSALEAVLTKPPIMTRRVFDAFVEDLEAMASVLPDMDSLRRYLEAKYFPHFRPLAEASVFRSLWRVVFKVTDDRCERNRAVNYLALRIMYERVPQEHNSSIAGDRAYFSDIHFTDSPILFMLSFLGLYPAVYPLLSDAAKTPLRNLAEASIDSFLGAWFLSGTVEEHVEKILAMVKGGKPLKSLSNVRNFCENLRSTGAMSAGLMIGIVLYGESWEFDRADACFTETIKPFLDDYDEGNLRKLLEVIAANSQTYGRGRARSDHRLVKAIIDKVLGDQFKPEDNRSFMNSIE